MHFLTNKPTLIRLVSRLCHFILAVLLMFFLDISVTQAGSPSVSIGRWDPFAQCLGYPFPGRVTSVSGPYDIDTLTRDSLPMEVSSSWHAEALKANGILIRSVAHYFYRNPEGNSSQICNQSGRFFHLRTSTMEGWDQGRGSLLGNVNNRTNDRVTDTYGQVLVQNGQYFNSQFNDCLQNISLNLANNGYTYQQILTHPTVGIYSVAQCGFPQWTNLTLFGPYYFRNSMINGNFPYVSGATPTAAVTPVNTTRQAETYWGHSHMDAVQNNPFGQAGTYVLGYSQGDKVEYLMNFGGSYFNLHLIGIADRPGPVVLNIYIDGYYKGQIQWPENDNTRRLRIGPFYSITYGTHAIAVEFQNDSLPHTPYDENYDRNFYIDTLGVSQ